MVALVVWRAALHGHIRHCGVRASRAVLRPFVWPAQVAGSVEPLELDRRVMLLRRPGSRVGRSGGVVGRLRARFGGRVGRTGRSVDLGFLARALVDAKVLHVARCPCGAQILSWRAGRLGAAPALLAGAARRRRSGVSSGASGTSSGAALAPLRRRSCDARVTLGRGIGAVVTSLARRLRTARALLACCSGVARAPCGGPCCLMCARCPACRLGASFRRASSCPTGAPSGVRPQKGQLHSNRLALFRCAREWCAWHVGEARSWPHWPPSRRCGSPRKSSRRTALPLPLAGRSSAKACGSSHR